MEMKKYKLGEIATVEISGVDKKRKDTETPVKLCNFTDVYHNWAITKDMEDSFMDATASEKEIKTFSLKKGQVAFTKDSETRDDIGIPTYIADNFEDVLLGYHTALITPDKTKLNGKYLNAFMNSKYIQKYFENNASGSGQRYTLSNDTLNSIPIIIPNLTKQKVVGNFFSNIDKKIALNKKINAKLEAMAKRLYDYWFVQFDYPDKNGKPYKTSGGKMVWNEVLKREIPEGWEVKRLGELFITNRGVSYSTKTITGDVGIPMINLASFSPDGSYKIDGIKLYTGDYSQEKVLKPFDLVMCNTQQTAIDFSKDIIGKALLIPDIFEGDITSSHHVNTLKVHDEKLKFYLYRLFNTDYFHAYISHFASGTNIMGLDFAGVENYTAVIPSDEILSKFADLTLNIEKKKSEIIQENKKLTDLRDRLLPLLMNGQVEVGINNSSEFCNAKLGKQATACDMNGQVEVEGNGYDRPAF